MSDENETSASQVEAIEQNLKEEYRSTDRVEKSDVDAGSDHDLDEFFGDQATLGWRFPPESTAQRIAERYSRPGAAIRELVSNAETACLRRLYLKLEEAGYSRDEISAMDADERIERSVEETGYRPIIEIEHNGYESNDKTLVVRDNGVGIARDEFPVLLTHGYSATASIGEFSDGFGQGFMSVFMLVGPRGEVAVRTNSVNDDSSYAIRVMLSGPSRLTGGRDGYGTTVEIPAFSEKGKSVSIYDRVAEFTEGLRVPVRYEEYNTDGRHVREDEFLTSTLEDDYNEDDPLVVYEDEYVKAVSSPATSTDNRDPVTWNTSMPIERNDARFGTTDNDRFDAPWKFDIKLKYEDGRVAYGPNAGLIPVDEAVYEDMDDGRQADHIPRTDLDRSDVEMPSPVDDRDRLHDGHRDFFKEVSSRLSTEFGDMFAGLLASVDTLSDVRSLDPRGRAMFHRGYSHFGPNVSKSEANRDEAVDTIVETLEDEVGVTIPRDLAEKLIWIKRDVYVVPRGCSNPSKKGGQRKRNRNERKIWEVITDAGAEGTVYMGMSISEKKARMVWDLHEDNVVVQCDDDSVLDSYYIGEKYFGWSKLKDLPSRNLAEKLPELSDEFLDRWDTTTASSSGSTGGRSYSYDRDRAKARTVTVRYDTGKGKYKEHSGQTIYDALDNGERIKAGTTYMADTLIVIDQNEHTSSEYTHMCYNGVALACVPSYVYEYLLEADNVYTPDGLVEAHAEEALHLDWSAAFRTVKRIGKLEEDDVVFVAYSDYEDLYRDRFDGVRERIDEELDDVDMGSFTIVSPSQVTDWWLGVGDGATTGSPTIVYATSKGRTSGVSDKRLDVGPTEIYLDVVLDRDTFDRASALWRKFFMTKPHSWKSTYEYTKLDDTMIEIAEMFESLDLDDVPGDLLVDDES